MPSYPLGPPFADLDRPLAVQGPAQFLFTGEDVLQIDTLCSLAGVTLTITGAMLGEGLQLLPFSFTHAPNSNRTIATTRVTVDSGWLQHVRVIASAGAPLLGQCFVFIRQVRGLTTNALALARITSGYVTATTDLSYPNDAAQLPLDSEGAPLRIAVTTPAAGADFTITVPTGARWQLDTVSGLYTASAAVANRVPELVIDDGANIVFAAPTNTAITGGQTARVSWGAGAGGPIAGANTDQTIPLANDMYLPGGFRIRSNTALIQAADTWTAI